MDELPRGKMKQDPFFGRTEVYRDRVTIRVPLGGTERASGSIRLKVVSQGCSDSGVCYIPQEQWVEVGLGAATGGAIPLEDTRRILDDAARAKGAK